MKYRPFGRTGLNVSEIGFGCWELGGEYGHFDETEVVQAIQRALDLGINCFDTAQGYGMGSFRSIAGQGTGQTAAGDHTRHQVGNSLQRLPF